MAAGNLVLLALGLAVPSLLLCRRFLAGVDTQIVLMHMVSFSFLTVFCQAAELLFGPSLGLTCMKFAGLWVCMLGNFSRSRTFFGKLRNWIDSHPLLVLFARRANISIFDALWNL
jgi:hypothetical protein